MTTYGLCKLIDCQAPITRGDVATSTLCALAACAGIMAAVIIIDVIRRRLL